MRDREKREGERERDFERASKRVTTCWDFMQLSLSGDNSNITQPSRRKTWREDREGRTGSGSLRPLALLPDLLTSAHDSAMTWP